MKITGMIAVLIAIIYPKIALASEISDLATCLGGNIPICANVARTASLTIGLSDSLTKPQLCREQIVYIASSSMVAHAHKDYPGIAKLARRADDVSDSCPEPFKSRATSLSTALQKALQDAGQ